MYDKSFKLGVKCVIIFSFYNELLEPETDKYQFVTY